MKKKKKEIIKKITQYFIVKEYYTTINIYLPLSRGEVLRNLNFIIILDCDDFISLTHKIYSSSSSSSIYLDIDLDKWENSRRNNIYIYRYR